MIKVGHNIWERLKSTKVKEKSVFLVLLVGMAVLLLPMLAIARYNVPSADDYSYGVYTHLAWERSHSLIEVIKGSVRRVNESYWNWQGTYTAVFVFSLQPAIFGEAWYPLTTYIMLISLLGGIAYLVTTVFRQILKAAWYQTGIVILVISAVCTQLSPSPVESFYWFNGSAYYTFFFGISLVLYAKILTYIRLSDAALSPVKKTLRLLSLTILSAIVAGTNFVTVLATAVLYTCAVVFVLIRRKRSGLGIIVPFCVFMAGFFVNIMAPGNSVRQALFPNRPSALYSIYLSFCDAVRFAHSWLTPALVFPVILLIPLLYKITSGTGCSYSNPFWVLSGSFCLFASMFFPPKYAMGATASGRLLNIVYYAFVILLIFDLSYVLGWCGRVAEKHGLRGKAGSQESKGEQPAYSAAFLSAVLALFLLGSVFTGAQYTSRIALRDLLQGTASSYYDTAMERAELLKDDSQQDVVLPRYSVKPLLLYYYDDVTTDPAEWQNVDISNYYQKNSVVLAPEE